jgi:large subunit ribosomal protein L10
MSKSKQQKQDILTGIKENLDKSKSVIFTINKGINAEEMVALRKQLFEKNSKYEVTKKTLLKIALKDINIEVPDGSSFDGAINTVYSYHDEISGAKVIHDLTKKSEHVEIIGGVYEGKYITQDQVTSLATMPSKEELYARFVRGLNAPVSGFVNALSGNIRNFVQVINAIKDKKESVA